MDRKKSIGKLVTAFLLISYNCIVWILDTNTLNSITAVIVLVIGLIMVIESRKNIGYFIIYGFILYANYSIYIAIYRKVRLDSYFASLAGDYSATIGINCLLMFVSILYLLFLNRTASQNIVCTFWGQETGNSIIVIGVAIVAVLVFIFGFVRPDQIGERGTPSTLYEYSVVLLLVGLNFSGVKKWTRYLLGIIGIAFAVQNILYGGRVTALQMAIMLFMVFMATKPMARVERLLPFVIIGFFFLSAIGQFRANYAFSSDVFSETWDNITKTMFANDTAYSAYYTSQTFIKVADVSPWSVKISMLGRFLLSMLLGGSNVKGSNLAEYTLTYYLHYKGGVFPIFGYFYMGILGVILFSLFVALLLRKVNWEKNNYSRLLYIYIVSSVPRWYLYSPSPLLRGIMLLTIVYGIFYAFNQFTFSGGKICVKKRE